MIDTSKHREIFDVDFFVKPVHIIGCGGMGSRVAEGLVRMGVGRKHCPITLYDHDSFEPHNLANQLARAKDVDQLKVMAVRRHLREINPQAEIHMSSERLREHKELSGVVFVCVDSMETRRDLMESVILTSPNIECVIETRMDATVGISHCFDPRYEQHVECWKQHWFSDEEADSVLGCSSPVSIISAIYGTTALALKQFEQFARKKSAFMVQQRLYHDFDEARAYAESWT